jgi:uncharacterized protein
VLSIDLRDCSAKVREGFPLYDPQDMDLDVWAGVIPLRLCAGDPVPDPVLAPGTPPSAGDGHTALRWLRELGRGGFG